MPVCSIVKLYPLSAVNDLVHYNYSSTFQGLKPSIFMYFSTLCEPCKDKHYEILYHTDKNYNKSVLKCKLIFFISSLPLKIIGEIFRSFRKVLEFYKNLLV